MEPGPTSIKLFLAEGTPDGLWVVEKSNWTGVALMAPRSRYPTMRDRKEMSGPGVYVLVGPPEGGAMSSRIYIGETDVLRDRMDSHHKNKDFWTRAVVFTSKDASLNKAHVRYLESKLMTIAVAARRAEMENTSTTTLPALSEADRADVEAFLADMLIIYPVLGINAFEAAREREVDASAARLFLKGKDTQGEGKETAEGFVVFAGAQARADLSPSIQFRTRVLRSDLIDAGVLVVEGVGLRLAQDFVFNSPSAAAGALLGRSVNGRTEWKDATGATLKQLQERAIED